MFELSTFQWVIFGVAGVLIASNFIDFKKLFKKTVDTVEDVTNIDVDPVVNKDTYAVSDIVAQWEKLRMMCEKSKLRLALKELDDVFPTFIENIHTELNTDVEE